MATVTGGCEVYTSDCTLMGFHCESDFLLLVTDYVKRGRERERGRGEGGGREGDVDVGERDEGREFLGLNSRSGQRESRSRSSACSLFCLASSLPLSSPSLSLLGL